MSCQICVWVGQYFINILNLLDHIINGIFLLGDADETVSARVARAREAGCKWAVTICKILTFLAKTCTFGQNTMDHCTYALDKSIRPNSGEIFNLITMSFNKTPVSEVEVIDNGSE